MVTVFRMKIDVLGQAIMLMACVLGFLLRSPDGGTGWTNLLLVLTSVWQIASAVHLYYSYHYVLKINYLRAALVLCVSLPVWISLIGRWAYLPVVGLILWYFVQTLRDTVIVNRRPRSFWDI